MQPDCRGVTQSVAICDSLLQQVKCGDVQYYGDELPDTERQDKIEVGPRVLEEGESRNGRLYHKVLLYRTTYYRTNSRSRYG